MRPQNSTQPFTFLFLVLPYGISSGFATLTLPYLLTQNGFSVAAAASITALGVSANIWRFAWAPLADLTLTLHKWYLIGVSLCAITLILLGFIDISIERKGLLTLILFISQIAATMVILPVGGLMAETVSESQKGRAGGWYQAGNLGGTSIGGGMGIWLSSHFSYQTAVFTLSAAILFCVLALYFVPQVQTKKQNKLSGQLKMMLRDIKELFLSPIALFTMVVITIPIAIGAAANLWTAVATEWQVTADTVALVNGSFCAIASILGCIFGGWIADKIGRWWAFFGAGILMALVTLVMSFLGFIPSGYVGGVLFYAFTQGMGNAAFSALVLHAIGQNLASTKYALLSSMGNLAPVYMTMLDGWLHDNYGATAMLLGETVSGIICVLISLYVLVRYKLDKVRLVEQSTIHQNIL